MTIEAQDSSTFPTIRNDVTDFGTCKWRRRVLKSNYSEKNFLNPNGSQTHDLAEYWLDALTTELWETRGEQGHFDALSLAVWQDTCHTYKNLVYDLAHHESPIAQWLGHPTGIWKVMGSTPIGGPKKIFLNILTWENFFII